MKTPAHLLVLAAIVSAFPVMDFTANAANEEGFVSMFDGKTLDGWHLMNGAPFVAEDGVIKLNGGRGWMRSDKEYSDFVLKLEFRFLKPERQDGGVFLRSGKEGKSWPNRKYEVQIENTERMAKIFGAKYELDIPLTQSALKPVREWNEYVIKLDGVNIEVHLNGELVSTSDDMSKLTRGYIGFQAEDGFHEYRNLRIKDLSK
jgi:hypothetical protein